MAERRMFAKTIIDSDAFLDMPCSTQCLYFHLSMRADDDGFINNPNKIQRMVGCSADDLRLLVAKKFIIPFESGIVVIKHWKIHNYIQKDRYKETVYQEEKSMLEVQSNNSYSLMDTRRKQIGYKMDTQDSIGESSLEQVEVRKEEEDIGASPKKKPIPSDKENGFDLFWNAYPKKVAKVAAKKAFLKVNEPVDVLIKAIEEQKKSKQWKESNGQFIPNPSTWLNQERWNDQLDVETNNPASDSIANYDIKFLSAED